MGFIAVLCMRLQECRPAPAVSIIETDIQVDFVPPKDYVQPVESENVSGFDVPETATAPSASSAKDPDATTAEQSSSQFVSIDRLSLLLTY